MWFLKLVICMLDIVHFIVLTTTVLKVKKFQMKCISSIFLDGISKIILDHLKLETL